MTIVEHRQEGPADRKHGHAPVNGRRMYYEILGTGKPLVYLPPVFGYAGLTELSPLTKNQTLISVDLQGHGRTADIDHPLSFEQHAEDVIGLLKCLGIERADFFGESFGGVVAMIVAVRHPEIVGRVATYGHWPTIWSKVDCVQWNGFSTEELTSLQAPVLIALGGRDFVPLGRTAGVLRLIPNAELAVIAEAGAFVLRAEQQKVLPVLEAFLDARSGEVPPATKRTADHWCEAT